MTKAFEKVGNGIVGNVSGITATHAFNTGGLRNDVALGLKQVRNRSFGNNATMQFTPSR